MPTKASKKVVEPTELTSESVSEGHPDKLADRISDEILDACLAQNPAARVAVETLVTRKRCILAGEVSGVEGIDFARIARQAIRDVGYADEEFGWETVQVDDLIHPQSEEIGKAVLREGAGDQGLMFGYACKETPELMPAPIVYAHRIVERLAQLRKAGEPALGPDAKSQVTVLYAADGSFIVPKIVVSHQHARGFFEKVPEIVRAVVHEVLPGSAINVHLREVKLLVNPSGSFRVGGPAADTGLTGRKIIVDTYGGAAPHGGGAFSGKDCTKVDRSAAYAARWLAKNVVASGIADRCLVQLAYAIGVAEPVSLAVNTFGTSLDGDHFIERAIRRSVDLTPRGLRERLGLGKPIYARTAAYGHFGRVPDADGGFSWERTELGDKLLQELA